MAKGIKTLAWSPARDEALSAWMREAAARGIDVSAPRFGGARVPSFSAAVDAAMACATACRCHEAKPAPDVAPSTREALGVSEQAYKAAVRHLNPLRSMREAAGLTQREAAELLGVARRTWQSWEDAAAASPERVAAARKAFGRAGR